jgi:acetyl-CoA carboxylase carboxyltransferase component
MNKDLDQSKLMESRKPTERKAVKKAYQVALHYQSHGPDAIKRHTSKGKLLARDRINLLIDKSSPFLELSPLLAAYICMIYKEKML